MTSRWSFLTPYAQVLLLLDADPDAGLHQLADDLGTSYRWTVKATSALLEGGYLERERHGRTFSYIVTSPQPVDVLDPRAARVQQLADVLERGTHCVTDDDEAMVEQGASELTRLRHEVALETRRLQRVRAECRHLEATIERARAVLQHPIIPSSP